MPIDLPRKLLRLPCLIGQADVIRLRCSPREKNSRYISKVITFSNLFLRGSFRLFLRPRYRRGSGQASPDCVPPYTLGFLISYITALRIPICCRAGFSRLRRDYYVGQDARPTNATIRLGRICPNRYHAVFYQLLKGHYQRVKC